MRTITNFLSLVCLIAITYSCEPEELPADNTINQEKIHADDTGNDDEGEVEDRNGN
ncbi:hypothetical protein [Zunongwangia pacifica]|uniref:Uncharacterized protein n=1 Tax=Zunongwangia pacifica TaxID=2911062 RepID=A0A9X1ZUS3_9FLAO|nr:hypothetical protein [Zunongwangia pacifica]MCL6218818.1 hypothetical protein [Zunongwangia pacifica]